MKLVKTNEAMTEDERREALTDLVDDLDDDELIAAWNSYGDEVSAYDDNVFSMDEFSEVFDGMDDSAWRAVRAAFYGNFNPTHDYWWFNGSGNLESSDDLDDSPIDKEAVVDYMIEHDKDLDVDGAREILDGE